MVEDKKKYLLICLLIVAALLYLFNVSVGTSMTELTENVRTVTGLVMVFTLIAITIHIIKKSNWTYRFNLTIASIFLVLNIVLATETVAIEIHEKEMEKIAAMDSCDKARVQFNADLKTNELKYFLFGLGVDEELNDKLENQYDLKIYTMGCIVLPALECYNDLVKEHLQIEVD